MVLALVLLVALSVILNIVCLLNIKNVEADLGALRTDLARMRQQLADASSGGGLRVGRSLPTFTELEAARNRIDNTGVAHAGGNFKG
jgi:hypothetical protein